MQRHRWHKNYTSTSQCSPQSSRSDASTLNSRDHAAGADVAVICTTQATLIASITCVRADLSVACITPPVFPPSNEPQASAMLQSALSLGAQHFIGPIVDLYKQSDPSAAPLVADTEKGDSVYCVQTEHNIIFCNALLYDGSISDSYRTVTYELSATRFSTAAVLLLDSLAMPFIDLLHQLSNEYSMVHCINLLDTTNQLLDPAAFPGLSLHIWNATSVRWHERGIELLQDDESESDTVLEPSIVVHSNVQGIADVRATLAPLGADDGVFTCDDTESANDAEEQTSYGEAGVAAAALVERYLASFGLAPAFPTPAELQASEKYSAIEKERFRYWNRSVGTKDSTANLHSHPEQAAPIPSEDLDMEKIWHSGQYALRKLYHESDRLIVVFFSEEGCAPCARLRPMLRRAIQQESKQSKVHFVEIDIGHDAEIAQSAGVDATPEVHFFLHKDRIQYISGVRNKRAYRDVIQANAPHLEVDKSK